MRHCALLACLITVVTVGFQRSAWAQVDATQCLTAPQAAQSFWATKVYVNSADFADARDVTLNLDGIPSLSGTPNVTLGGVPQFISLWTYNQIKFHVAETTPPGAYQLDVTPFNGPKIVPGLTFRVLGDGFTRAVFKVGPYEEYDTRTDPHALQNAISDAFAEFRSTGYLVRSLVVVDPGTYKGLLGVPWGVEVQGSGDNTVIDLGESSSSFGGSIIYGGITVGPSPSLITTTFGPQIDGLTVRGADEISGIFVSPGAYNTRITNNNIWGNSGTNGGGIRAGKLNSNLRTYGLNVSYNRIFGNTASGYGGGGAILNGFDNYSFTGNFVCGNKAKYGGGLAHFGLSNNGSIRDSDFVHNRAYAGGGIYVGGPEPSNPSTLSLGSGPVNIFNNNLRFNGTYGGDGAAINLYGIGTYPINMYNLIITNNIVQNGTGAVYLADTTNTRIYDSTFMNNITLGATAGPAGISTRTNSMALQATLPAGSSNYSNPGLFNNIFWGNKTEIWNGTQYVGAGYWDIGSESYPTGQLLYPFHSIFNPTSYPGVQPDPSNVLLDPQASSPCPTPFVLLPGGVIQVPFPSVRCDYSPLPTSPAIGAGAGYLDWTQYAGASTVRINIPPTDFFGNPRPQSLGGPITIGAIQFQTPMVNQPTLTGITPATGAPGTTGMFTLTGTNLDGATVSVIDPHTIIVNSFTVVNSTTITLNVTIPSTALPTDVNDIYVTTPGGTSNSRRLNVTLPMPMTPGPPTGVMATAGAGSAIVSWTAPTSNGGSQINSYTITPYIGSVAQAAITVVSGTPPTTMAYVPMLNAGTTYTFTVSATNGAGTGPSSASTPVTTPAVPTLTAASPTLIVIGRNNTLTLTGANLTGATAVTVSGTGIIGSITVVNSTTATATLSINPLAAPGPRTLTVTGPAGSSNPVTFTVAPPPAILNAITPASGVRGSNVAVTLTGSGLAGATAANFSGTGVTVGNFSVVNDTTVTASLVIASNAALGAGNITVAAPGGASNPVTFTVTAPLLAPMVTSSTLSTSLIRGLSGTPFIIFGTNLTGATVSGEAGITFHIVSQNDTQITGTVDVATSALTGFSDVNVTTPGGTTTYLVFVTTAPQPTLTSFTPVVLVRGSTGIPFTLDGTNLTGATLSAEAGITFHIVSQNNIQITGTIDVANSALAGLTNLNVTTPGGTTGTLINVQ